MRLPGGVFALNDAMRAAEAMQRRALAVRRTGTPILNRANAGDAHFGIICGAAGGESSYASRLCLEMMSLKKRDSARQWLMADPENRELFTLQDAVEFGDRFFAPLPSRLQGRLH